MTDSRRFGPAGHRRPTYTPEMARTALPVPATAILAALLLAPGAGAQNSGKTPDRPLDFDPLKWERVEGWWTNGTELLRLDPNGAYRLWVSQDRFKRPIEVGAWRRTNYAFFDLEPYRTKAGTRHRVTMQKDAGVTELHRDGMADFRGVPVPPRIPADEMLGAWVSPTEELLVLENGRYEWRRTTSMPGISEHGGQWITEGDAITLVPETDAVASVTLRSVQDAAGTFTLEGPGGGRMTRPPTAPAAPAPGGEAQGQPEGAPAAAPQPAPGGAAPASTAPGAAKSHGDG